jgi:hypothetical protein
VSTWTTIYLIAAIVAGAFGIWNLARGGRNAYLNIAGILWFVAVLVRFYVRDVATFVLVKGLPNTGDLILYLSLARSTYSPKAETVGRKTSQAFLI